MDAFYAAVEQRDNPDLQNKPIAVGWDSDRGVIATASYEARKFGVHSALPVATAKKLCPGLIIVKPRMDVYKTVSRQIRKIFEAYTDLVEPLSLDEAYLDVTSNKLNHSSATQIAKEIKSRIKEETRLTASAGISINKFLAKVASDINKPDGLTLIHPNKAQDFLKKLDINKFHGIGKVTAKRMRSLGISRGMDIIAAGESFMVNTFGKNGKFFYDIARGVDTRDVTPQRERKSVSVENTFAEDLFDPEDMYYELRKLAYDLSNRIKKTNFKSKTLTLKIKYIDFKIVSKSKTLDVFINEEPVIVEISRKLIGEVNHEKGIRLLGLGVSRHSGEKDPDSSPANQLTLEF